MNNQELVKHVGDGDFEKTVLKNDKLVLVDFWAPWCGPCRATGPILEELAGEFGNRVDIVKINVDDNPQTSSQYAVRSIPTLMIIKDGVIKDFTVGLSSKDKLAELINRHLN